MEAGYKHSHIHIFTYIYICIRISTLCVYIYKAYVCILHTYVYIYNILDTSSCSIASLPTGTIAGMLRTWPLYRTTRCWRPGKASVENLSAAWKLRWDPSEAFDPTGDEEGQGNKLTYTYSTFLTPLYIFSSKVPLQRPAFTLFLLLFTSICSFPAQVRDLAQKVGVLHFSPFGMHPVERIAKKRRIRSL